MLERIWLRRGSRECYASSQQPSVAHHSLRLVLVDGRTYQQPSVGKPPSSLVLYQEPLHGGQDRGLARKVPVAELVVSRKELAAAAEQEIVAAVGPTRHLLMLVGLQANLKRLLENEGIHVNVLRYLRCKYCTGWDSDSSKVTLRIIRFDKDRFIMIRPVPEEFQLQRR
eukprot:CAMPEP_0170604350 /NCGR_PEP_ID=MMETSP0224-20130122/19375_1 /TAXON_ID=285029 /ORGANISM="Togula jolla, Strain CCCM 725" /LENGTH=168 /DNA_ID=CAMNT_0010929245 /DNA_START=15 /DNA_END=521 /DNA_ORIENTATION=-